MSPSDQLAQNILDLGHSVAVLFVLFVMGVFLWVVWAMFMGGIVLPVIDWLQRPHVRRWLYREVEAERLNEEEGRNP